MSRNPLSPRPLAATGWLLRDLSADLLGRGYGVRFRAPGQSMHPTIREGETILVRPVSPNAVRKGDIVLYGWSQGVIAHRVVGIERTGEKGHRLLTRGDAAGAQEEVVAADQVLGRVVAAERNGRSNDLDGLPSRVRRFLYHLAGHCRGWVDTRRGPCLPSDVN